MVAYLLMFWKYLASDVEIREPSKIGDLYANVSLIFSYSLKFNHYNKSSKSHLLFTCYDPKMLPEKS